jgi:hypothetical protein
LQDLNSFVFNGTALKNVPLGIPGTSIADKLTGEFNNMEFQVRKVSTCFLACRKSIRLDKMN